MKENYILLKKILRKNRNELTIAGDFVKKYFQEIEKINLDDKKIINGIKKNLKNKNHLYYLIKFRKQIVGLIHLFLKKRSADLCLIYILPEFRRKGFGTLVLKKIFKKLKNKNIKNLKIEIYKNNKASIKFFTKLGAKLYSYIYYLKV
ncbi:hypothetical protein HRbin35_00008 [bacterium HR35]|nr:hypothetical protein HRbin35_00008 [bacterium HR35]